MEKACTSCALSEANIKTICMPAKGNPKAKLMAIFERPSFIEDQRSTPFISASSNIFLELLQKAGISYPNDIYMTYAAKCFMPDDVEKSLKKTSLTSCYSAWLTKEIVKYKPSVVLAVGAEVLSLLLPEKIGIMKNRGVFFDAEIEGHKFKIIPTLSPGYLLQKGRELDSQVVSDLRRAHAAVTGGIISWSKDKLKDLKYKTVENIEDFREMFSEIKEAGLVACDIEARRLDMFKTKYSDDGFPLVSIQFSTKEKTGWFLPVAHSIFNQGYCGGHFFIGKDIEDEVISGLRYILESGKVYLIGHNFKFDAKWIKQWLNITPKLSFDTMLTHGLFEQTSSGLKNLAWTHCVDPKTECLSKTQGWTSYSSLKEEEEILVFNVEENITKWEKLKGLFINENYSGNLLELKNGDFNSLTTLNHKWPISQRMSGKRRFNKERKICIRTSSELANVDGAILRSAPHLAPQESVYSDALVELIGWYFTEGNLKNNQRNIEICQSYKANPEKIKIIRDVLKRCGANKSYFKGVGKNGSSRRKGLYVREFKDSTIGMVRFGLSGDFIDKIVALAPTQEKIPSMEFLTNCTEKQLQLFINSALLGDGNGEFAKKRKVIFYQSNFKRMDAFVAATTLLGYTSKSRHKCKFKEGKCYIHTHKNCNGYNQVCNVMLKGGKGKAKTYLNKLTKTEVAYSGTVWCPITYSGHWVARRDGAVFITGNSDLGGYEEKQAAYTETLETDKKWDMFYYPFEDLATYGCCDVDVTLRVYNILSKKLDTEPELKKLAKMLVKASNAFVDIEWEGIKIDKPYLYQLGIDLNLEMKKLEADFRELAVKEITEFEEELVADSFSKKNPEKQLKNKITEFNIASNDHICTIFYDKMHFPVHDRYRSKKTKDPSVGKQALELLGQKYPIALTLLKWRTLAKQLAGFVDAYPEFIDGNSRIHPDYKLIKFYNADEDKTSGTSTGRLACSNPNIQQVPSRGDGKKIKKLFIPDYDSHYLIDMDFSGIELRVMAMYTMDPLMINFFKSGSGDFHRYTASKIYGVSEDQITDLQRSYAKTTVFAILYGAGPAKIADQVKGTVQAAQKFIDDYFNMFPTVKRWISQQKSFAIQNQYVISKFGRKRALADASSKNEMYREAALRQAVNSVIQSDASDITLTALTRIASYLRTFKHADTSKPSALRASVHDSILLSVHEDDLEEIINHVKFNILEKPNIDFVTQSGVQLASEVSIGRSWGDQRKVKFE